MTKPVLILGSGGHASVIVDILRQLNYEIVGLVSPDNDSKSKVFSGIDFFISDDDVLKFDKNKIKLVNGLGSLPGNKSRSLIYNKFVSLGYEFETIIASTAFISSYAELGNGVQVFPGVIIQAGASIGANSIINTGAIIEHDCIIGQNNHIAPGVTLSGQVTTEEQVHIGTGASVIQSVFIGKNTTVGAGAVINKNVSEYSICYAPRGVNKVMK